MTGLRLYLVTLYTHVIVRYCLVCRMYYCYINTNHTTPTWHEHLSKYQAHP